MTKKSKTTSKSKPKASKPAETTFKLKAVAPITKAKEAPVAKVVAIPQAAVVKPMVVSSPEAVTPNDIKTVVKKPEFIDRIVTASGMKKSDVKPVVEAALAVLSKALLDGEQLQLPPLGKVKVQNIKDVGDGAQALTLKVRTAKTKQD